MNLFDYKELIDGKPMHIATINTDNNPNLSVASDISVLGADKIIISVNEMNNTGNNSSANVPTIKLEVVDNSKLESVLYGDKE